MNHISTDMHSELNLATENKYLLGFQQINEQNKTLAIHVKSFISNKARVNPVMVPNWNTLLLVLSAVADKTGLKVMSKCVFFQTKNRNWMGQRKTSITATVGLGPFYATFLCAG